MKKMKRREDLMCEADQPLKRGLPHHVRGPVGSGEPAIEDRRRSGDDEDIQTRRRGWEECGAYPA